MIDRGDVLLFQTLDDGEIIVENGTTQLSGGLETTVYLSLFGGNEQDPGGADKRNMWWGSIGETELEKQYRSETQYLLRALPVTSANLQRMEAAAMRDLAWLIPAGVASDVVVSASIPAPNKIDIAVSVEANGEESDFVFSENWRMAA